MEIDPNLDPELRFARFYALMSAALGVISLCAGIIPVCGGLASILGIVLGLLSLKTEKSNFAFAGILLSILGALITLTYFAILVWVQS
jgi:hypothetical protein